MRRLSYEGDNGANACVFISMSNNAGIVYVCVSLSEKTSVDVVERCRGVERGEGVTQRFIYILIFLQVLKFV